MIFNIGLFLF